MRKLEKSEVVRFRTSPAETANIKAAAIKLSKETGHKPEMSAAIRHAVKLYINV